VNISVKAEDETEASSNPRKGKAKTIKRNQSAKKTRKTENETQQIPTTVVGFKPVAAKAKKQPKHTDQLAETSKPTVSFALQD